MGDPAQNDEKVLSQDALGNQLEVLSPSNTRSAIQYAFPIETDDSPCDPSKLDLSKIPDIMDAQKPPWEKGAALLREWFSNPPSGGFPDTSTITMKWVLGFDRAKKKYDTIFQQKLYINKPAQLEIQKLLRVLGKDKGGDFSYDDVLVIGLYPTYYINEVGVSNRIVDLLNDPLDDLFAALAAFSFLIVVGGKVEKEDGKNGLPDRFKVSITKVGVFVHDSFDFEDDFFIEIPGIQTSQRLIQKRQPLGCWNICTKKVSKTLPPGCSGVFLENRDFRNYRAANEKGGDFHVFSDVKTTHLSPPESFYLP